MFVDADNVSYRCVEKVLRDLRCSPGRNMCVIRAYKDWSKESDESNMFKVCGRLGIEQVQVERVSGKNSSDIKMCIDITSLLYTSSIEEYVLLTGDSDFKHVLIEIRNRGKRSVVLHPGPRENSSLAGCAHVYALLD